MVLRRSKGYQDIDGSTSTAPTTRNELNDDDNSLPQDIEMASVSVVPDGKQEFVIFMWTFL